MSGELAKALVAAQKEMPKVEADAVNPHFKSRFTSLDHLIAKTRPILAKHGLAIVQEPCALFHPEEAGPGTPALKTTLVHESGESRHEVMPLLLGGQDMQKLGAAITYARRYAWAALLGISEQEDDDGAAASAPSRKAAGQTPPAKQEAPAPAPPAAPSAADLTALYAIVERKAGPEAKERTMTGAAMAEERGAASLAGWYAKAKANYDRMPEPSEFQAKADAAVKGRTKAAA